MPLHHGLRAAAGASPADPYFSSTSLLLLGNGTNGGQNNTFVDGSTNNFTVTRNGNTTQGSFSPFSAPDGRWSNYFDGSGDYLSLANNTAFQLSSGNWTIECWIYITSAVNYNGIVCKRTSYTYDAYCIGIDSSNNLYLTITNTAGSWTLGGVTLATGVTPNTWHHIAVVRNSNTITGYLNGTAGTPQTFTGSVYDSGQSLYIGSSDANNSGQLFNGYISNFRLLKGTALYTTNFTPPTSSLTAITNTSLLTCQSNRFKDNSSNAFAITPSGDAAVTSFSPFAPLALYDVSSNGGSGYFDGSGDYLSSSNNLTQTGNFTIEGWINTPSRSTNIAIFTIGPEASGRIIFYINSSNQLLYDVYFVGSTNLGGTVPTNSWVHIAFVRSGTTVTAYINGVATGTTATLSGTIGNSSSFYVGSSESGSNPITGYMTNVRVTNSALYTGTFTPPTSPLTAITNTSLLLNFTNASILDSTAKNDLETVGDAQISTSVKKFGTGSLKFDGTGDYLSIPDSSLFDIGAGDFTIECWVNFTAITSSTNVSTFAGQWRSSSVSLGWLFYLYNISGTCGIYLSYSTTGTNQFNLGVNLPSNPSIGTWYHYAVCRNGSNLRFFVDGTQIGSTQTLSATIFNSVAPIWIAAQNNGSPDYQLNGYLDDFRLTKYARYTSNFTPPSAQLPAR